MIISQTPLRISFLGGGTDYYQFYSEHGGAVISTSIDKYCYVLVHEGKFTKWFDLPERAGLGTSSAFTVGLLRIWNTEASQRDVAQSATLWEMEKLNNNIGVQDQFICSVGGFRMLNISESGIRDYEFNDIGWLNPYLMLFNTHQYRMAGKVVASQLKEMNRHIKLYERLLDIVDEGKVALLNRDYMEFGCLLDESWKIKRQLSKYISNVNIDGFYERALEKGAIGGKLLGAGGGGFMLFLAPPDKQEDIKRALVSCEYIPFRFDGAGTRVIFEG